MAVTRGPGLAGSLLVGINFAKALAFVHDLPLVGVNHLEGHVYAAWLQPQEAPEARQPVFPLVALVVSGGHTFLVEMRDHLTYRLLGQTVDDAAGEAFDKVGPAAGPRLPGRAGDHAFRGLRRPIARSSFRGPGWGTPTTSASAASRRRPAGSSTLRDVKRGWPDDLDAPLSEPRQAALAYGFQESVVDVLVTKTIRAAEAVGARSIVLGGGVAANRVLRERLAGEAEARRIPLIVPPPALCTDNGAMIGAAAARRFEAGERAGLDLDARPSLPLALPVAA